MLYKLRQSYNTVYKSPTCPANFTFLKYPFIFNLLRAIKYACSYLGGGWDLVLLLKTPYYARNACLVTHNQVRTLHVPSLRYSLILIEVTLQMTHAHRCSSPSIQYSNFAGCFINCSVASCDLYV